ncbi:ATP-binding cassette domain-containing protein [Streptomyces sp. NPDC050704]|uniref:ABC transporter ATP-binding protein n=1 Tax=Streptomyces sp. NPDC050704 TaxID=3157219 RepID=UPI0034149B3C
MPIIQVEGLTKEYHRPVRHSGAFGALRTLFTRQRITSQALQGVDFEINSGELVGYLGPNGAGKSTTIKILTGILQPTRGVVEVAGKLPWRDREENALNIGVVFGQRTQLWWDLPLRDSLDLIAKLYGVSRARYKKNMETFAELLDLQPFLDTPVRQLSLGQRMRGDLAAAMLPQPRILFLDEPTIGLDVVARERMREFIANLNREEGTTVILTTHDLADVERLCPRIILIDGGRVLYDGSVSSLKARYAPHRQLVVQLAEGHSWVDLEIPGVAFTTGDRTGQICLHFLPDQIQAPDLIGAVLRQNAVTDMSITEPELEGVVRRLYSSTSAPTTR